MTRLHLILHSMLPLRRHSIIIDEPARGHRITLRCSCGRVFLLGLFQ